MALQIKHVESLQEASHRRRRDAPCDRRTFGDVDGPGHHVLHVHRPAGVAGQEVVQGPPAGVLCNDTHTHTHTHNTTTHTHTLINKPSGVVATLQDTTTTTTTTATATTKRKALIELEKQIVDGGIITRLSFWVSAMYYLSARNTGARVPPALSNNGGRANSRQKRREGG